MIYEKALANPRAGMYFDSREETSEVRDNARYTVAAPRIEPVGNPVKHHRMQARIAEQNLEAALGGRILALNGLNMLT
jgi:hypothetical protein